MMIVVMVKVTMIVVMTMMVVVMVLVIFVVTVRLVVEIIIGPESDHCLPLSLTHSLTP